jgi:hypothetical protein
MPVRNGQAKASRPGGDIPDLPTPSDEQWSVKVERGPDVWELIAIGPERGKESQLGWQVDRVREGVRYRRLLRGADDRDPQSVRRVVRSLIWHRIVFRPNPIASLDPRLAAAFEDVVWEALRRRRHALQVRFNVWEDAGERRFVCKVEALPNGSAEAGRRWWSPLVGAPEELASALAAAFPPEPGDDDAVVPSVSGPLTTSASLTASSGA